MFIFLSNVPPNDLLCQIVNSFGVLYLMGRNMLGDTRMGKGVVKEHSISRMERSLLGNGRMGKRMVKEHSLSRMERSLSGNGRMEKRMVKEHTLGLLETNILGNIRMIKDGTEYITTKTETA